MNPCSRSPWAAWFRFMKSMSISVSGISTLYCVARWHQGFWSICRPVSHILDGLNVWHHVITPAQAGSWFASSTVRSISSGVLAVTL